MAKFYGLGPLPVKFNRVIFLLKILLFFNEMTPKLKSWETMLETGKGRQSSKELVSCFFLDRQTGWVVKWLEDTLAKRREVGEGE